MTGSSTSNTSFQHPLTLKIAAFLQQIGISVRQASLPDSTFLPGIHIEKGSILIDESRLTYPGDLLHEAGHLAMMEPDRRAEATGDLEPGPGMAPDSLEMAAIAWSYAAALHIGIDPAEVFHQEGYRGSSDNFLQNFREGRYVGVPVLAWRDMTTNEAYPAMSKWLV
ncbi:hypothetical protein AB9P05_14285 [Roseivirga sp. BDSF3-8]|uniref:hypothetical protein n=1 Tax=Roseivirga sp. BDSF3-8 TaxID=3241598 RepID=UPI00353180A1